MCGIVGAVSPGPIDARLVTDMRDRLRHRGPDHGGLWQSEDGTVSLGHRRLAIVDLTPEANQPFRSHDGRFVITFNGEIYNFRVLRRELEAAGAVFRTSSDTEVLVEAYRRWGEDCLPRLSGMFAFAIWDHLQRRLFCARDRAGEKPFHYAETPTGFIFASELKSLLVWPGLRLNLDESALVDYLFFGFIPDPKSIWASCRKLPPGHFLSVSVEADGERRIHGPVSYWDMRFARDGGNGWNERIVGTLQDACREMSFADVPVGAFLSGGIDSSAVTAGLRRGGSSVTTFTIGFEEQSHDERPWARRVAELYGTTHVERVVTAGDVEPVLDQLLWHYDEPFNDYSYLPTFYLCREARRSITVALSGDGGDELFAGYSKYKRLHLRQMLDSVVPESVASGVWSTGRRFLNGSAALATRLRPYAGDVLSVASEMLNAGIPFSVLKKSARGALRAELDNYSPADTVGELLLKAPPAEVGLVNSMRYLDMKLTLAGDMLVKVDRASMAVALEVRPVFLHRDMLALAGTIPGDRLVSARQAKRLLKSALAGWLPEDLLYRRKQGFAMPLGKWLDDGAGLFDLTDSHSPVRDWLDVDAIRSGLAAAGPAAAAARHSIGFLQRWLEKWK